jgi:hypothetical protein
MAVAEEAGKERAITLTARKIKGSKTVGGLGNHLFVAESARKVQLGK